MSLPVAPSYVNVLRRPPDGIILAVAKDGSLSADAFRYILRPDGRIQIREQGHGHSR
jgi:hypothetical protein